MNPEEIVALMEEKRIDSIAHITVGGNHKYYQTRGDLAKITPDAEVNILSMEIQSLPGVLMKKPPRNAAYKGSK